MKKVRYGHLSRKAMLVSMIMILVLSMLAGCGKGNSKTESASPMAQLMSLELTQLKCPVCMK